MRTHGIEPIDLVVSNLYPFEEVRRSGAGYASIVENIDIGGPAMIRASAKNHAYVAIVTDPGDYASVLNALEMNIGSLSLDFRKKLAAKAFARTASYDAAISGWFAEALEIEHPTWRAFGGRLVEVMRYGENPHQGPASTSTATSGRASPPLASCRASSSPTTTSTTPTPPSNWPASSTRPARPRSPSSSMPTPAASPRGLR
ncbi:hypothetical protein AJ88_30035 [Mesorhizobium amorphae CCBAU 01583]|nr:hypothetical protein AJ88_30035 [Mesorhizobium amorphae CCBAU 01583]